MDAFSTLGILLLIISFGVGNVFKPSLLDCTVFVLTLINIKHYWKSLQGIQPIKVFVEVAIVSLLFAASNFGSNAIQVGALYLVRWVLYSLLFLSLVRLFTPHKLKMLLTILGIVTVAASLGQYILFPDVRFLAALEWDDHYYRVVGSWLDPGFTGLLLVFTFIYLLLNPLKSRFIHFVTLSLCYLSLALTYSRSSYLAFLVGMAWIAWKQKGWKFFAKALLLLTITIYLLPRAPDGEGVKLERTNSIWSRIDNWSQAITIWSDHPILGVGFNTYRYAQKQYGFLSEEKWQVSHAGAGADSSLLFVAATTGIIGLAAYLWYLKRLYISFSNNLAFQATFVALLAHSFFLNSLFYPAVMLWMAVLTALTDLKSR